MRDCRCARRDVIYNDLTQPNTVEKIYERMSRVSKRGGDSFSTSLSGQLILFQVQYSKIWDNTITYTKSLKNSQNWMTELICDKLSIFKTLNLFRNELHILFKIHQNWNGYWFYFMNLYMCVYRFSDNVTVTFHWKI